MILSFFFFSFSYINVVFPSVDGVVGHDTHERDGETFAKEALTLFALGVDAQATQPNGGVEKALEFALGQHGHDPARAIEHLVETLQVFGRKASNRWSCWRGLVTIR